MVKCEYTKRASQKEGDAMLDKKIIAGKLVALRRGVPRENVSKEVGISVSALQMYECAQRVPRDEIKIALARYYKTSVEQLFFDDQVHIS